MPVHPFNLVSDRGGADPVPARRLSIGVLALQGDYIEHRNLMRSLGIELREVRLPRHLEGLQGLIIPGGESTTIGKLATDFGLVEPLRSAHRDGCVIWGTCAGLIFLARKLGSTGSGAHIDPPRLKLLDITVNRNTFGRQVDSFELEIEIPAVLNATAGVDQKRIDNDSGKPFRALFIRAPGIAEVGPEVTVLARVADPIGVVGVQAQNLLGTTFHPELTGDNRFHRFFLSMVESAWT